MLAARLYGKKDIRLEDIPLPAIGENEVLLKVKRAAVCGSDVRMYNNGYKGVDEDHPLVLGHEFSGIIDKVGQNVVGYKKGMRVAVAPNVGCGICDFCTSGNTHLCTEYKALGINLDGGFAEYVRIPEAAIVQGNLVEISEDVSYEEAAINEPLSCVYNGFERCAMKPGDYMLVVGVGPIGILHGKLGKMTGAVIVILSDLSQERLDLCQKIDREFITVTPDNLKEKIMKITNDHGLDVCIIACPSPQAQASSLELMAMNGRINFFGGIPKDRQPVPIDTNLIHYKQLIVTGSTRASVSQYRKTLNFIASGLITVRDLITQKFPLNEIQQAFETAMRTEGLKNIIFFE